MKIISIFFLIFTVPIIDGISLDQLICQQQPHNCRNKTTIQKTTSQKSASETYLTRNPLLPQRPGDFSNWNQYGKTSDDGTGYGAGVGPGYGPGLGDIAIRTGVGVHFPFGNIGVRRDFELGFGGSGRIGGMPVGFGNGYSGNGLGISQSGWPHDPPFTTGNMWPLG